MNIFHFQFQLLSIGWDEGQWYFGIAEIDINHGGGHLFYIQNYYGWQFEILYCRMCFVRFMDWARSVRRRR